jgi:hypothetical protein
MWQRLLGRLARVLVPAVIEVVQVTILIGKPDEGWNKTRQGAEARLARSQFTLTSLDLFSHGVEGAAQAANSPPPAIWTR